MLTVNGTNLDSVAYPLMNVKLTYTQGNGNTSTWTNYTVSTRYTLADPGGRGPIPKNPLARIEAQFNTFSVGSSSHSPDKTLGSGPARRSIFTLMISIAEKERQPFHTTPFQNRNTHTMRFIRSVAALGETRVNTDKWFLLTHCSCAQC